MSIRERHRRDELMDRPDAPAAELRRSLSDLRAVNRWLGGTRTLLGLVAPLLERVTERPIRVLDVATGSGDIPVALARWAAQRGEGIEVTAADLHPGALAAAREVTSGIPSIRVVAADATELPFATGSFHVATCCTALHHFEDDDAVRVLRELRRVATHGVVVLDLRRSVAALAGVGLLAATVWRRHHITRHDGPVSVRAAFTAGELLGIAERAGYPSPVVRGHSFIRLSLTEATGGESE